MSEFYPNKHRPIHRICGPGLRRSENERTTYIIRKTEHLCFLLFSAEQWPLLLRTNPCPLLRLWMISTHRTERSHSQQGTEFWLLEEWALWKMWGWGEDGWRTISNTLPLGTLTLPVRAALLIFLSPVSWLMLFTCCKETTLISRLKSLVRVIHEIKNHFWLLRLYLRWMWLFWLNAWTSIGIPVGRSQVCFAVSKRHRPACVCTEVLSDCKLSKVGSALSHKYHT